MMINESSKQPTIYHLNDLSKLQSNATNDSLFEEKVARILEDLEPESYNKATLNSGGTLYSNIEVEEQMVYIYLTEENNPMTVPMRLVDIDKNLRKPLIDEIRKEIEKHIDDNKE